MADLGNFHRERVALIADIDRFLMSFVALLAVKFPHVRIMGVDIQFGRLFRNLRIIAMAPHAEGAFRLLFWRRFLMASGTVDPQTLMPVSKECIFALAITNTLSGGAGKYS